MAEEDVHLLEEEEEEEGWITVVGDYRSQRFRLFPYNSEDITTSALILIINYWASHRVFTRECFMFCLF